VAEGASPVGRVTAVTVNYNAGVLLQGLVEKLSAREAIGSTVVVDNASADASLCFLEGEGLPRVKLIRNADNRGFSAACNQGAAGAEGDYLLFINPDCRLAPGALQRLVSVLDQHAEAGMAGPLVLNPDGSEQRGCRRLLPTPRRALMRVFGRAGGFDLTGTPLPKKPVQVEAISGACLLIRRRLFEELGGWDEGYFLHCEDLDLCMRVKRAGKVTLFVPDAAAHHVQGVSSRRRPVFVLWHKHLGMWRYFSKFQRGQSSWWLPPLVAAGIAARFLLLAPRALLSRRS
jgi:GT2 family glycosyltransferase